MPNVDPKGTTRFADEATLKYIAELEAALERISTQSWGTPESWYREYAKQALQPTTEVV